ncbi:hypothetical protein BH11ACT8_BH11ACT8_28040 [soil metagenome]
MVDRDNRHRGRGDRTVRPRGVWGGLAVAVLGLVLAGAGGVLSAWGLLVAGSVLVVVGAVTACRSGALYAVHTPADAATTAHEIVTDETYQGSAPGDLIDSAPAREKSRSLDHRREAIERQRSRTPVPALAPGAGIVLVLMAIGLLVAAGAFFPHTSVGSANADRALGCAIVAAATGMRFLLSPGRHQVFAAAAGLAGGGLILSGVIASHDRAGTVPLDVTCGAVVVLAAIICWASPTPVPAAAD